MRFGRGAVALLCIGAISSQVSAQSRWNDSTTRALVLRGVELRARQLADTGLRDYAAKAHGYLAFLAQLGDQEVTPGASAVARFLNPPRVVKADELALEIYWKAPNKSRQRIVGRRDTLLLPTDIDYHRDHLGIVQHNFPSIIRLGEGDEVRDVAHPLSPAGAMLYDFAITDSLTIRLPDRAIQVYEVKVRPRDERMAAIIGALYLERESAQIVRMAFGFTRSAFKDEQLEDLSIVLDNALIDGRFWLPMAQEIEIRRSGSWMRFPARGIIRGRWQICCYELNQNLPDNQFGPVEIVLAPAAIRQRHQWTGQILDSLPSDVRAVTPEEVRRVREEARALVRAEALARTKGSGIAAGSVSDVIRVNRVEGVSLGLGTDTEFGGGFGVTARGRYGFADERFKAELTAGWQRASGAGIRVIGIHGLRDAADVVEGSGIRNTIAAQEFGSDYTQPYRASVAGLALDFPSDGDARQTIELTYERHRPAAVHAAPASGAFEATIAAFPLRAIRARLRGQFPRRIARLGFESRGDIDMRVTRWRPEGDGADAGLIFRAWLNLEAERPVRGGAIVLRTTAGGIRAHAPATAIGGDTVPEVPVQELLFAGGPVSGPGYDFHAFAGDLIATQRIEWRTRVPFVSVPFGRFGRAPASATLAPFLHAVVVRPFEDGGGPRGAYPAAGVSLLLLFDAVRIDVARGLRDGRWTFNLDLAREFWGVL